MMAWWGNVVQGDLWARGFADCEVVELGCKSVGVGLADEGWFYGFRSCGLV